MGAGRPQNQHWRSFHPTRSGNIHLVHGNYWFLHPTEEAEKKGIESIAATHNFLRANATCVPIIFAGNGVSAQQISRRVAPTDTAPTLAAYLSIEPLSGSVGCTLTEALPHQYGRMKYAVIKLSEISGH